MYDLASLYGAKSNVITKAANIKGNVFTRFGKEHPYVTGAAAAAGLGATGIPAKIVHAAGQ